MKQTLVVVIDALSSRVIKPALEDGYLPVLQRLAQSGVMREECISIFPSITPAATAAIVTGCYPCDHGVAGAYFYDTEKDHVNYFGTDFWAVQKESFSQYFEDFLVRLNRDILRAETLYQQVERQGLTAGCINYMIYRGDQKHQVNMPWLMKLWPGIPFSEEISGPKLLFEGDFVHAAPNLEISSPSGGMLSRFGFQDETTAEVLLKVAESGEWPDFTLAYFPDNDFMSHSEGPAAAVSTVKKVDECLGKVIDLEGGFDAFLAKRAILILGDHSQSDLFISDDSLGIDVADVLQEIQLVAAGADWTDESQLMACPNMRACQFYLRRGHSSQRPRIIELLLSDSRIDQLFWRNPDSETESNPSYYVATADRGRLQFRRCEEGEANATDDFGNFWRYEGALETVDASLDGGRLRYQDYPNAFERIATSFDQPTSGDLWATARPGHEFKLPETTVHDAGSHGSLHQLDSATLLITAGVPAEVSIPDPVRTVDIAPICRQILGIAPQS